VSEAQELLFAVLGTLARTGRHLQGLRERLADRLPAEPAAVAAFEEDTILATDSLSKRFEQQVDALRTAARTIVRLLGEENRYRTVRQVLDRLESLEVVPQAKRVMELVELRNRTAHAYAPDSVRQAQILNSVYASVDELLDLAARFARFAREQRLLPAEAGPVLAELETLGTPG